MKAQSIRRLSPPSPQLKTVFTAERGDQKPPFFKPLPTRFRHDGFDYRQIAREEIGAIYEQIKAECPDLCAFEVVRIRRREGVSIAGEWIEPAEVYLPAEAWGADVWTCADRDGAFARLKKESLA